jgi:hypothetical protein
MSTPSGLLAAADQTCCIYGHRPGVGSTQGVRSHLADGRFVSWSAAAPHGLQLAVDAEISNQTVPPALAHRFGIMDPHWFWPAWTAVEVSCKLRDVPILTWLSDRGLTPDPQILMRTFRLADLTVTCGVTSPHTRSRGARA